MQSTNTVKFGIKPKLFLLVLITISLVIAIILWRIDAQSKESSQETIKNSLAQSESILTTKLESQFNSIEETVVSLSKDGRVLPLVYDQDSATLQDLTTEFERALNFQSMMITDHEGFILARSDRPEAIGFSLAGRSQLFDKPLQGEIAKGFILSSGQIQQLVNAPVFDNVATDIVRGTISLTYELSSTIAQEIFQSAKSDVDFYIFSHDEDRQISGIESTYSTRPDTSAQIIQALTKNGEWKSYITLKKAISDKSFTINDNVYRAIVHPIARNENENIGFVIAYRSETELLKPFKEIEKSVSVIGAICLGLALLAAWLLASRIASPIIELVSLTDAIDQGNYPKSSKTDRSDEIGILQQALLKMGKSLKDKNELETYLADIADVINSDLADLEDEMQEFDTIINDQSELIDDTQPSLAIHDADGIEDVDATVINQNQTPQSSSAPINISKPSIFQEGDTIANRYNIVKLLGRGATAEAYVAFDSELEEEVAIKILFNEYITSDFATMFKEEIKLARQITHRNILRTFDFGSDQGLFYITMEYIQGYDLRELINIKGKLSSHIAVIMARQICSALAAAHETGIIHRDLKPENMIINRQGVLKIMDFGLAMKVSSKNSIAAIDTNTSQHTTVAGTPKYMAPEQFTAGEMDQRTDIYAVGIILFVLLTGKTPFNARDFESLAYQHHNETVPPLSSLIDDVPTELENIMLKALMKNKEERYQSIQDMLADLNRAEY